MSTHTVCFYGEIRKYQYFFVEKSVLSGATVNIVWYSSIPLLRPPLVLPKSGHISKAVLILNVEHISRLSAFSTNRY